MPCDADSLSDAACKNFWVGTVGVDAGNGGETFVIVFPVCVVAGRADVEVEFSVGSKGEVFPFVAFLSWEGVVEDDGLGSGKGQLDATTN